MIIVLRKKVTNLAKASIRKYFISTEAISKVNGRRKQRELHIRVKLQKKVRPVTFRVAYIVLSQKKNLNAVRLPKIAYIHFVLTLVHGKLSKQQSYIPHLLHFISVNKSTQILFSFTTLDTSIIKSSTFHLYFSSEKSSNEFTFEGSMGSKITRDMHISNVKKVYKQILIKTTFDVY